MPFKYTFVIFVYKICKYALDSTYSRFLLSLGTCFDFHLTARNVLAMPKRRDDVRIPFSPWNLAEWASHASRAGHRPSWLPYGRMVVMVVVTVPFKKHQIQKKTGRKNGKKLIASIMKASFLFQYKSNSFPPAMEALIDLFPNQRKFLDMFHVTFNANHAL